MTYIKKSKYVGNHDGRYIDKDGITQQFTYIDYSRHTTRLKPWKSKEYISKPLTKEEILIEDIIKNDINSDPLFVDLFDNELGKKFEFERVKKGSIVEDLHRDFENWYIELEKIYKIVLFKRIAQIKKLIKKDYELQRKITEENI